MMTAKQRVRAAFLGQKTDTVPVVNMFSMAYLKKQCQVQDTYDGFVNHPLENHIAFQESIDHDPLVVLYMQQEPKQVYWCNKIFSWREEDCENFKITNTREGDKVLRTYTTPAGTLQAKYLIENGQNTVLESPVKDYKDIELLRYRPDPAKMDIEKITDYCKQIGERAFIMVGIPGPWQEACFFRGFADMLTDLYEEPEFVHELLQLCTEYTIKKIERLRGTGIDCIMINESYAGCGISRSTYEEFMFPYDKQVVAAANKNGFLTSLHVCGKCKNFFDEMIACEPSIIEPLACAEYSGDIELEEAIRRAGDRVALWGGMKERELAKGPEAIKAEVYRCMELAKDKPGYILRGCGQFYDADPADLKLIRKYAREYEAEHAAT